MTDEQVHVPVVVEVLLPDGIHVFRTVSYANITDVIVCERVTHKTKERASIPHGPNYGRLLDTAMQLAEKKYPSKEARRLRDYMRSYKK